MGSAVLLGVDAGGTFTDFVCLEPGPPPRLSVHKTLSSPEAPERAILDGIRAMGLDGAMAEGRLRIVHGSTVATNAALEGRTARTAFVTNRGFGDLLLLARQTRPALYALEFPPRPPPVSEELCLETGGRVAADGAVLDPLSDGDLDALVGRLRALEPEAVAVNLLFSFLAPRFEERIEAAIRAAGIESFVSLSSKVLPVYREYERGVATWLNAALGPVVGGYLARLGAATGDSPLQIMQSSGETIAAAKAADQAVRLLLSGPAGGLNAMRFLGRSAGMRRLISFDMGGTSTDVALLDGAAGITDEGRIGPYPVGVPMVDMHTIGAGGGSIAYVDSGGALQVGPESAGARPGPACYGRGGTRPTVTDANLVAGRLAAGTALAGGLRLDRDRALEAVASVAERVGLDVGETAMGIIRIADEHMAKAIREISVNRGHDPKDFVLASFGGAGGLHVCALAEAMRMDRAMAPARGGALSALGMLVSAPGRQFARTVGTGADQARAADVERAFDELADAARGELLAEGLAEAELDARRSADLRYAGQSYTLNVPWSGLEGTVAAFHKLHEKRYGYALAGRPTELVNIRVGVVGRARGIELPKPPPAPAGAARGRRDGGTAVVEREALSPGERVAGPAIVAEYSATTYVAPGWQAALDEWGNLMLDRTGPPGGGP